MLNPRENQLPRDHAIIFGAPRSGTTSLWRYLAKHPEIAASRVKELNFFASESSRAINYDDSFPIGGSVTLEASPVYFHEHEVMLGRIAAALPQARMICLLREPARRLVAAYRSERDWHNRVSPAMTFEEYAKIVAKDSDPSPINPSDPAAAQYVKDCSKVGLYADILSHYLDHYDVANVQVHFLDRLQADPHGVVTDTCTFLGLDPSRLPATEYTVENQGVNVRNLRLFHILRSVNSALEPALNKTPKLRHRLKTMHQMINGAPKDLHAEDEARGVAILREWHAPHNRRLSEMLDKYFPELVQPDWLRFAIMPKHRD